MKHIVSVSEKFLIISSEIVFLTSVFSSRLLANFKLRQLNAKG